MNGFEGMPGAVKWPAKSYQITGAKWLASRPSAALFWAPGLAKTSTVLAAFKDLKSRNLAKRMLILAPLRVCQGVWRQERDKWLEFNDLKIGFAHGELKAHVMRDKSLDIVLLNYDGLLWACSDRVAMQNFDVVCFDELTRMKHSNTRRFKMMREFLPAFKFRWGLTGTPAPNGLMDLFGQVFMLDGGQRLGKYITHYRFSFFHKKPFDQWSWYPNDNAHPEITRRIANLANYIDEKDWNKMPALIRVPIRVDLPEAARKKYKAFEKDFIMKLEAETVTAANAAVLSGKLRQAASGAVYTEDRKAGLVHEAKLDALEDLVEELAGDPVIIAVGFLHEVEAIRNRLGKINGKEIPYLGGGVTSAQADKIISHWNLGWLPVLLVHPTSVAHGLNLQSGGRNLAWYSLTWNSEERDQLIRRIYRQGQAKKVFEYMLLAHGTIDYFMLKQLGEKDKVQSNLLQGLRDFYGVQK